MNEPNQRVIPHRIYDEDPFIFGEKLYITLWDIRERGGKIIQANVHAKLNAATIGLSALITYILPPTNPTP